MRQLAICSNCSAVFPAGKKGEARFLCGDCRDVQSEEFCRSHKTKTSPFHQTQGVEKMRTPIASNKFWIDAMKRYVYLRPRKEMRRLPTAKRFVNPRMYHGPTAKRVVVPASFSWSGNGNLKFPVLGNDQVGDCYYAAACHGSQTWTGNAGTECVFDESAVIARYLAISGGDNGLSDSDIFPEWKGGIVGPNGPHKILDDMTVLPGDDNATALAMYAFCGLIFTASLLGSWLNNASPGAIWDANGRPDPSAGHAMFLTGKEPNGNYELQTWGFSPCVNLTPAGLKAADPELVACFSLDMFNAAGLSPAGQTYEEAAALWNACGGNVLPPSPFPPTPIPPPNPPTPAAGDFTISHDLAAGSYTLVSSEDLDGLRRLLQALLDGIPSGRPRDAVKALLPPDKVGAISFGKILQIVLAVIAFASAGDYSPVAIAAFVAVIQQILSSP